MDDGVEDKDFLNMIHDPILIKEEEKFLSSFSIQKPGIQNSSGTCEEDVCFVSEEN